MVQPEKENALKFELFIFDVLPLAERWTVVETSRTGGVRSAEERDGRRLAGGGAAGDQQPGRRLAGSGPASRCRAGPTASAAVPLEISPLFALDAEEFARKVDRSTRIDGPRYFG